MSSQPVPGANSVGTCPVCFHSGLRLTSKGVLYNHGPRASQCPGTAKKPIGCQTGAGSSNSQGEGATFIQSSSPASPTNLQSSNGGLEKAVSGPFSSSKRIIKWIPKGARAHCAPLLTRLLN